MRLRATALLLISLFFVQFAQSQSNELIVQGQTGKLYLEHTVVARENWYSIGRLYNVNPKELAPYNKVAMTPLVIGQTLRIPLTAGNFSQNGLKTPAETLVPVMYVVQEKEWMYRISVNHNKVPIPTLEKWNHITGAQVHPGMHLIVGYLKVKTALSALATVGGMPTAAEPAEETATRVIKKPVDTTPVASVVSKSPTPKVADNSASTTPASSTTPPSSITPTTPTIPTTSTTSSTQFSPHFNGGAFKSDFSDGDKSASGQAGIFKSTSGWQDGKYYALMNNVAVGTIVKISDATTGRSVYAKVLGQLPDMKESVGLTVRLSNAAAAELGEGDAVKFNVAVSY